LQSISGVSAINPLVAFYDIHGGKREVLFFYFVPDTTRDKINYFIIVIRLGFALYDADIRFDDNLYYIMHVMDKTVEKLFPPYYKTWSKVIPGLKLKLSLLFATTVIVTGSV
jgi:hypothetical protein